MVKNIIRIGLFPVIRFCRILSISSKTNIEVSGKARAQRVEVGQLVS